MVSQALKNFNWFSRGVKMRNCQGSTKVARCLAIIHIKLTQTITKYHSISLPNHWFKFIAIHYSQRPFVSYLISKWNVYSKSQRFPYSSDIQLIGILCEYKELFENRSHGLSVTADRSGLEVVVVLSNWDLLPVVQQWSRDSKLA